MSSSANTACSPRRSHPPPPFNGSTGRAGCLPLLAPLSPVPACSYTTRHSRGQCCSQIQAEEPAAISPQGLPSWRKKAVFLFCFPVAAGWDPCQPPSKILHTRMRMSKKPNVAEHTDHKSLDLAWPTYCMLWLQLYSYYGLGKSIERHFISSLAH